MAYSLSDKQKWTVLSDGKEHSIIYRGNTLLERRFKIVKDGAPEEIDSEEQGDGLRAEFSFAGRAFRIEQFGGEARLFMDGVLVPSEVIISPVEEDWDAGDSLIYEPVHLWEPERKPEPETEPAPEPVPEPEPAYGEAKPDNAGMDERLGIFFPGRRPLPSRLRGGRSSFLMMIALTYANLVIVALGIPLSFPFSAFLPVFSEEIVFGLTGNLASAALVGAVVAGVYVLLYRLAAKRPAAIMCALILFVIDTAVFLLIYLYEDAFGAAVIDLLFHVWVIGSLWGYYRAAKAEQ